MKSLNFRFGINDSDISSFLEKQTNKSFIIKSSIRLMIFIFGNKDLIFLQKAYKEKGILGVFGLSKLSKIK